MLAKRIIACLDVRDGQVVKGVQFKQHQVVGEIVPLSQRYSDEGIDELVFYDITASSDKRVACSSWINQIAKHISIPFCVAGGIASLEDARSILYAGADKISINSPALARPELIDELSQEFGRQCITVGVDSQWIEDDYYVYQYTGDTRKTLNTQRRTREWITQVQQHGAGEIVLNCMQSDGVRKGYDIEQLQKMTALCDVPLIASGGAGNIEHFVDVFKNTHVSGALAASVFHHQVVAVRDLKLQLKQANIEVRND